MASTSKYETPELPCWNPAPGASAAILTGTNALRTNYMYIDSYMFFYLGFSVKVSTDVVVANVTLVDNGMGIMPMVYSPPALAHLYADKTVDVEVRRPCGSVSPFPWISLPFAAADRI